MVWIFSFTYPAKRDTYRPGVGQEVWMENQHSSGEDPHKAKFFDISGIVM